MWWIDVHLPPCQTGGWTHTNIIYIYIYMSIISSISIICDSICYTLYYISPLIIFVISKYIYIQYMIIYYLYKLLFWKKKSPGWTDSSPPASLGCSRDCQPALSEASSLGRCQLNSSGTIFNTCPTVSILSHWTFQALRGPQKFHQTIWNLRS